MKDNLRFIKNYSQELQDDVQKLIDTGQLKAYLLSKYPTTHTIKNDKALFDYVMELKNSHMKKSGPLSKVAYDSKINVMKNALGTHHFISRVQGGKLKAKNEIYIATIFKNCSEDFLRMIVIHELAHFKQKEHNKAFYNLCAYMDGNYHQLEFDFRLFLIYKELYGDLYEDEIL